MGAQRERARVNRAPLVGALAASAALLAVRLYAAKHVGFGDAEALYACYARHPQPVYVDHPGLIGVVARIVGGGSSPSPWAAHQLTAWLATAAPWVAALAARAAGASPTACARAALVLMLAPEISVGLFGLTPDLLLILLWYAALGTSLWALAAEPGSMRALVGALGSGLAAGLAFDAKITGGLLLAGLALGWAAPQARSHRRTLAPFAGLALALVMVSPVILDEVARGFPMLHHRLIDTQKDAGLSLRNVGALLGGQLLYVTPPLLLGAFAVFRDLHRRRCDDAASQLLWSVTMATLPLVLLCCVSRVAEPHWVAPVYLALPLHLARGNGRLFGVGLARSAVATGAIVTAAAHAWVLFPIGARLLGGSYTPRYDLANDLYAWQAGLPVVRRALAESIDPERPPPIVVGPHWTVCAQAHAGLAVEVLVGCHTDAPDDFARWLPASVWQRSPTILYVTDDRFDARVEDLRDHRPDVSWQAEVRRGGVLVRRITVLRLIASAVARANPRTERGSYNTLVRPIFGLTESLPLERNSFSSTHLRSNGGGSDDIQLSLETRAIVNRPSLAIPIALWQKHFN